ncbi:hypothetical protein GY45DRAFT_1368798 [Cubamyces sp. BRFM 1775]|nr:hypothetical protein GY45DRAFT_1368798 [Cubamyces sp. BRFM 1775]
MANPSDLPAGAPVSSEETSAVPRTPLSRTALPRTPSPTDFRELHVDPLAPGNQQDHSQTTSEQETVQDTLSVPNQPLSLNDASPVGKKSYYQSRNYASVQQPDVKEKRRKLRLSMRGKTIIVEYDEFMSWFVPAPPGEEEPTEMMKSVDLRGVATTPERKMYKPLVDALNQDWLLPNDRAISNPDTPDPDADTDEKIDAGLYRRSDVAMVGKKTRWAYMELSIECKTGDVRHDPFDESNPSGDHEDASAIRQDILGQIMCYSGYIFDYQRRIHHYTLIIFGRMVRIIRWDRAGVVATKPFDYVAHPELLLSFIWRFARMTPAQRGHDPTATRVARDSALGKLMLERARPPKLQAAGTGVRTDKVDQKDSQACTQATTASAQTTAQPPTTPAQPTSTPCQPTTAPPRPPIPGDHPRAAFEKSLKGAATIWWRLRVDDAKGARYFLVGNAHFRASGLAGRGTQTFIAIDEADPYGPFVYLKDAWRVAHTGIEQEGKILERLNSNDDGGPVPFVPTVRCHGDVEDQMTRSQEIWRLKNKGKSEEECPLKTHRHYRLVVNEVGIPMSRFTNMEELVGLFELCIQAHGEAYNRKGLIHRDISAGNVLIYPRVVVGEDGVLLEDREPLLADWELAKNVNEPDEKPRQPDRTGTWQFLSASALSQPSKRIIVQDDIESLFHLLLYHAIRFLPHNCSDVGAFMDAYFDGHAKQDGLWYGGEKKLESMRNGRLLTPIGQALYFYLLPKKITAELPSSTTAAQHHGPSPPPSITHSSSTLSTSSTLSHKKSSPPIQPHTLHPVNNLFTAYLQRLSAFYTLYGPPLKPESIRNDEDNDDGGEQPTGTLTLFQQKLRARLAAFQMPKQRSHSAPSIAPEELTPERRAELQAVAATLGDHKSMSEMFLQNLASTTWPSGDRCPDQLPPDYKPEDTFKDGTTSQKRSAPVAFQNSDRDAKRIRSSVPS